MLNQKNVPSGLSSLESKIDKLDVDKLIPALVYLSQLSFVAKNDVVKKDVYNSKIRNIKHRMPDITNLATNAYRNAKINEVKSKIPRITNLDTTTALITAGHKIPNVSNLVERTTYNRKIHESEKKITDHDYSNNYITTLELNRLTAES